LDGKPSKSEVIGCCGGMKKVMVAQNQHSRTQTKLKNDIMYNTGRSFLICVKNQLFKTSAFVWIETCCW